MLIKAYELVSGKQKDISISTSDKVEIPIINRKEYLLMGIEDNFMQLLTDKGELIENIKLNSNDVSKKLLESFENKSDEQEITVSVMHFMNQTLVDDFKMK